MAASSVDSSRYALPQPGASLLLAFTPPSNPSTSARRTVLILGQHRLAAVRTFSCLEAGLDVFLAVDTSDHIDPELEARLQDGQVRKVDLPLSRQESEEEQWKEWMTRDSLKRLFDEILLVCVTDTLLSSPSSSARLPGSALAIRRACYSLRIPINIADHPSLSDFHFPASYRFPLLPSSSSNTTAPEASPLQIAITTNAKSCRLASRIRREIVSKLPRGIGSAVQKVGQLREAAHKVDLENTFEAIEDGEREEGWASSVLNKPVPQILMPSQRKQAVSRCTSPNRAKTVISKPTIPIHPSHLPLTPPLTPPATTVVNKMEEILSGSISPQALLQSKTASTLTRMRFIAQICRWLARFANFIAFSHTKAAHSEIQTAEYWPIERLATLSDQEASRVISLYSTKMSQDVGGNQSSDTKTGSIQTQPSAAPSGTTNIAPASSNHVDNGTDLTPRHGLSLLPVAQAIAPRTPGRIFLLGSGPGSPALLTMAAHTLLTKKATLILSDKLVPPEVLALIPKHIPLTIAKKFPGNAEGAQNELMDLAYEGALRGETVVRLKQGDPYVYGRGGEEVLFFRERGIEAVVIPGISSSFAAPLMAGIPVTQRGVSESVIVCTGVGRKGKGVKLPGYIRSRTLVVLMGVARLQGVVNALVTAAGLEENGREGGAREDNGDAFPLHCPIAIIERGSSPDQRVVSSTLANIVHAMEHVGDQRPPGMMIIGWSALALYGKGDVTVLDEVEGLSAEDLESVDKQRVDRWLGPTGYRVQEGLDTSWFDYFDKTEEQERPLGELEAVTQR